MSQLESLGEPNIAQPDQQEEKESYAIVIHSIENFSEFEILRHCTLKIIGTFIFMC